MADRYDYRVIDVQRRPSADGIETSLNNAAQDGFRLVRTFSVEQGGNFAIMERRAAPERRAPAADVNAQPDAPQAER